ncbi:MAG: hypothetical protein LBT55_07905 [Clostridiaceae bacterium]|jgi:hypothetical protein|nr:hypothetical protein [Clostridiaceae bacterium]
MSKEAYEGLIYQINSLLKQWDIYPKYMDSISGGKNNFNISQTYTKKNYDTAWIETIEECLVPLDTIVRNPRKFIVIEEDIVDISLARSVSVESVKHLAQHTNLISSVTKDGMVIPAKILNTSKEESFEIYENRFIYTLLLKVRDFIDRRFEIIKNALLQSGDLGVDIKSEFQLDGNKVQYQLDAAASFPFTEVVRKKGGAVTDIERITRMKSIISDFLSSAFAREMRTCAPVRPPIQRTNVILKDPNFKKALLLWQFVETSESMEFKVENMTETAELSQSLSEKFRGLIFLNTVLMQSIASTREAGESIEESLKKDDVIADEYVTKNIDDYVPDDFPQLKMELSEIRRIYQKMPFSKTLSQSEVSKINGAIDRVLRQIRINKAKADSELQQKLIEKQFEDEKHAKKLALREARDLERKRRHDEALHRLERKILEREREAEERRAEEERVADERRKEVMRAEELRRIEDARIRAAAAVKLLEEQAQRAEEQRKEALEYAEARRAEAEAHRAKATEIERLHLEVVEREKKKAQTEIDALIEKQRREEDSRRAYETAIAKEESDKLNAEEEAALKIRLTEAHKQEYEDVKAEQISTIDRLKAQAEKNWIAERELAFELFVKANRENLTKEEDARFKEIQRSRQERFTAVALIEKVLGDVIELEHMENVEKILEEARQYRTPEEIDDLIISIERSYRKRSRHIRYDKFKKRLQLDKR